MVLHGVLKERFVIFLFQEDKYSPDDEEGEIEKKKEEVIEVEEVCLYMLALYLKVFLRV